MLTQQATVIAYDNTFKLLMVLTLVALPLVLVIGSSRAKLSGGPAEAHAMD
jgi:DHA2 family multidrug resistance protein